MSHNHLVIDTVRYNQKYSVKDERPRGTYLIDKATGLRVSQRGKEIEAVEVSLPRILFGTNSKLIDSQAQIEEALHKADAIVRSKANAKPLELERTFTRVDLVWHFVSRPPEKFLLAHRHCNHPEVRTKMSLYRNANRTLTGCLWEGDKIRINMYDKTDWRYALTRKVIRVEITLRGRKLRQKLANGAQIKKLALMKCYRCYRARLQKFSPKMVPTIRSKDEALFVADRKGIPVFEQLDGLLKPEARRKAIQRRRKMLATWSFREYKIDWKKLLPANALPKKYDAGELKRTKFKFPSK